MNRTDRLYALVEELRARAPRLRTAAWLAAHFEVSVRTIERDLSALQQGGTPIFATQGRAGGYGIDPSMTLPPLNFTPAEAAAVAAALLPGASPLPLAARSAAQKVAAAMRGVDAVAARELGERLRWFPLHEHPRAEHAFGEPPGNESPCDEPPQGEVSRGEQQGRDAVAAAIERAVVCGLAVALVYADRDGVRSRRVIEPVALMARERAWYVAGWCRLRLAPRLFRLDRITLAVVTDEPCGPWALADIVPSAALAATRALRVE